MTDNVAFIMTLYLSLGDKHGCWAIKCASHVVGLESKNFWSYFKWGPMSFLSRPRNLRDRVCSVCLPVCLSLLLGTLNLFLHVCFLVCLIVYLWRFVYLSLTLQACKRPFWIWHLIAFFLSFILFKHRAYVKTHLMCKQYLCLALLYINSYIDVWFLFHVIVAKRKWFNWEWRFYLWVFILLFSQA